MYYNYVITKENYHLLKPMEHNRGGEDVNRWKYYVKAYKKGGFNFDLVSFKVGIDGTIYEGNHKAIALMNVGEDIIISIVPPQKIEDVAEFNSSPNSKWKPEQQFETAISMNSKTAILMNVLKVKAINTYSLNPKQISAPEMYGILTKNPKHFQSGQFAPTLKNYNNDSLASIAASDEYEQLVMKFAEMKSYLRNLRDMYKIGKAAMEYHFDENVDFNLNVFVDGLKYNTFTNSKSAIDIYEIRANLIRIYRKELKFKKAA